MVWRIIQWSLHYRHIIQFAGERILTYSEHLAKYKQNGWLFHPPCLLCSFLFKRHKSFQIGGALYTKMDRNCSQQLLCEEAQYLLSLVISINKYQTAVEQCCYKGPLYTSHKHFSMLNLQFCITQNSICISHGKVKYDTEVTLTYAQKLAEASWIYCTGPEIKTKNNKNV